MKEYWTSALDGIEKILISSFLPIWFWSSHLQLAISIENRFALPDELRPIFLTAILIAIPGALLYPAMKFVFRRCRFELSFSKKLVNLSLSNQESTTIKMTVKICTLPWLGWLIVKKCHLTFNVVPSADIVLVKCADRKSMVGYTKMTDEGRLQVDLTRGVRVSDRDTTIEIPVILQPQSNGGCVTLMVEGHGGIFFKMLVNINTPKVQVKVS